MKKKRLENSEQSIFPAKNSYEEFKPVHRRRCSNVSRLRIDKNGDYEECGSQGMGHLNKRKRKNFTEFFLVYIEDPIGMETMYY